MDSSDSARSQTRVYQSATQPTNSAACAGGRQSTSLIKGGGKLVQKEAICPVQAGDIGFMSPIFVVPKSDGLWRPVINLKSLNQYVRAPHFKLESIKLVKGLIQEGDWLTKLDLKDAYLTFPVYQAHQKYLRFQWQDQQWQFKVLPLV